MNLELSLIQSQSPLDNTSDTTIAAMQAYQQIEEALSAVEFSAVNGYHSEGQILTTEQEKIVHRVLADFEQEVAERVQNELFSWGPLEELIDDQDWQEVIINGPRHIFVEKDGEIKPHDDRFLSCLSYRNFIERLKELCHVQMNLSQPYADGTFNGIRIHMIAPPITPDHSRICLRRHRSEPWTFEQLRSLSWASQDEINLLLSLMERRWNLLFVGPTSSGKTTILNTCLQTIPDSERVIAIEDTAEVRLPNFLSSSLLTRSDAQKQLPDIDQGQLIRQALRMRPDRIVVGEVRGAEAKDLLLALATGHRGSLGTLHAESARQAIYRLEMLVQMGAPMWSTRTIQQLIQQSIDAVVVINRKEGKRQLDGIFAIKNLESTGILLEKLEYNHIAFDTRAI